MPSRALFSLATVVAIGLVAGGTVFAAEPKKVGGDVSFSLTTPPSNSRDAQFSGDIDADRKVCRKRRTVTLTPASDNFPNVTGYIVTVQSNRRGRFSGEYKTPGKPDTYAYSLTVEKVRRTVKGQVFICKRLRAPAEQVTTTN